MVRFMKITKFERVCCSAISEQVKIYIIQHTTCILTADAESTLHCRMQDELRTDHHVSPRGCCGVLVPENTILFAPDSRLPVEGYKWRSVSCPRHHEEYESCPMTDEADINPGNHQGLDMFHESSKMEPFTKIRRDWFYLNCRWITCYIFGPLQTFKTSNSLNYNC